MKTLMISAFMSVATSAAFAGTAYSIPKVAPSDDTSAIGALVLLGLVAIVVASSSLISGKSTVMTPTLAEEDEQIDG